MQVHALPNREYRQKLNELDEGLSYVEPAARTAIVLLGAANAGTTDYHAIAKETGLPVRVCKQIWTKAVTNGIFKDGKICHSGWFDKESGWIAFWIDVNVVNGLLARVQ